MLSRTSVGTRQPTGDMSTPALNGAGETAGFESGKPRRIHWTCRFPDCGRSFTTWTRRGLRVTCPHCHRVQEGPAGVRRLLEKVAKKSSPKAATALVVVAAKVGRRRDVGVAQKEQPASNRKVEGRANGSAPRSDARGGAGKTAATTDSSADATTHERSLLDRVMGFS